MSRSNLKGVKFKVGDKVSVPVRFGETGVIRKKSKGRFGVEFHDLPLLLWYDANELRVQAGPDFRWARPTITMP